MLNVFSQNTAMKEAVETVQLQQDHQPPEQITPFERRDDTIVAAGLAANTLPDRKDAQPKIRGKLK